MGAGAKGGNVVVGAGGSGGNVSGPCGFNSGPVLGKGCGRPRGGAKVGGVDVGAGRKVGPVGGVVVGAAGGAFVTSAVGVGACGEMSLLFPQLDKTVKANIKLEDKMTDLDKLVFIRIPQKIIFTHALVKQGQDQDFQGRLLFKRVS